MIISFGDGATEDIFDGVNSKRALKLPQNILISARRKLDMLNAAHDLKDLQVPPGNRLHKMEGNLRGFYSIRINDQFRILFGWADGNVRDVEITDYH